MARALLEAVANGDDDEVEALAHRLADAVLRSPEVQLALAVAKGGPLAVTKAVKLAGMLIRVEAERLVGGGG